MEEKKKKVSGLVALVGEESATLLLEQIDDSSEELYTSIVDMTRTFSETMRAKMIEMVNGVESLSKERRDEAMDILRTEVLAKLVCSQLQLAGTLQAEVPMSMSEYAAHALLHYEEGIQASVQHSAVHSLQDLLRELRGAPASETN